MDTPPSQDSERLASCPGPGSFLCSPEPSRLPFVHGQGLGWPQLRVPWRGKASIWCPVCPAGPALEPAASLLGESLVASTCSPGHWAQQGAGTRWGAEPAFREARLSRDQTPAPGCAEGWVPSAPGRPAAQGPRLSPSLSPPLSGHQCAGEMARSCSFRGTAASWFADPWFGPWPADLCGIPNAPYSRCAHCQGPFLGFLSQASGKLAFPGSRRGSRPGLCWENALEDVPERGGGGSRSTGWWRPWGGTQGFQVPPHPPRAGMLGEWAGM